MAFETYIQRAGLEEATLKTSARHVMSFFFQVSNIQSYQLYLCIFGYLDDSYITYINLYQLYTLQKYDAENHVKSPRNQDAVVALDEKAIDKMVAFWVKTLSHCWLMDGSSPKYGIDNRF
jgi:hypothetical protein